MENNVKNRVIVITGGSTGIGKETARLFAGKGAIAIAVSRNIEKLRKTKEELGKEELNLNIYACDVSKDQEVKSVVSTIIDTYGSIDILINNAGAWL
jgi:NAD(P)-dependent dehydrogenase (short-subunit alcohol dehydrogenase family)